MIKVLDIHLEGGGGEHLLIFDLLSQRGSTLIENNLLLWEQIISYDSGPPFEIALSPREGNSKS